MLSAVQNAVKELLIQWKIKKKVVESPGYC